MDAHRGGIFLCLGNLAVNTDDTSCQTMPCDSKMLPHLQEIMLHPPSLPRQLVGLGALLGV